ncbi:hypothetical protein DsansV1_C16g0141101 [Dioscorea sansibarensis]
MCCPSRSCCLCLLVILVVLAIGFVFGFGVFAHGFHKLKNTFHLGHPSDGFDAKRPFIGAPPPF